MKIFLISLLLLFSLNSLGQIEKPIKKGNYLLGGSSSLAYENHRDESFNFNMTPNIGYFLIDNLSLGLNPVFDYRYSSGRKDLQFGLGPFLKYYFNKGVFLKFSCSYMNGKSKFSVIRQKVWKIIFSIQQVTHRKAINTGYMQK